MTLVAEGLRGVPIWSELTIKKPDSMAYFKRYFKKASEIIASRYGLGNSIHARPGDWGIEYGSTSQLLAEYRPRKHLLPGYVSEPD
jgi:hypothetical protein